MKELIAIQKELKAPKGQTNSFGKYKYRSCEDILEAVKPLLAENKVILTLSDDVAIIGTRIYVKATATLYKEDGAQIASVNALAREAETKKGMDESQITGMASSYARKYALNGLFCIDDTKDADTDSVTSLAAVKKIGAAKINTLKSLIVEVGTDEKKMLAYYKVDKIDDLTENQFISAMKQLTKNKEG